MTAIGEPDDNELRIVVAEAIDGGLPSAQSLAEETNPQLRKMMGGSRLIVPGPRSFEVRWNTYVAYSVRNESYATFSDYDKHEGKCFVVYSQSRYLDFVERSTFARKDYPGPFTHWGLICLNHVVDVISMSEPRVTRL